MIEPIVVVNLHYQFEEIALMMIETLTRRGHSIVRSRSPSLSDSRLHLLFGVNVLTDYYLLPPRYIVMQLEQVTIARWFVPGYFARLAGAKQVWDYNRSNIEALRRQGIEAIHVPLGYCSSFDYPLSSAETLDLLFIGQEQNTHRQTIFTALRQAGLSLITHNRVHGRAKQQLVASAKIVLNLHHGQDALLEEARILPLLAQGKVVISEDVTEIRDRQLYQDVVTFVSSIDELISACRHWLSVSPEQRSRRGAQGRTWVTTLRRAWDLFPELSSLRTCQ